MSNTKLSLEKIAIAVLCYTGAFTLCFSSSPAMAASPEKIGKTMAEATMCAASGRIAKPAGGIIKLKVADKYDLATRSAGFKRKMERAKFKALENFETSPDWTKDIACDALKDKWL